MLPSVHKHINGAGTQGIGKSKKRAFIQNIAQKILQWAPKVQTVEHEQPSLIYPVVRDGPYECLFLMARYVLLAVCLDRDRDLRTAEAGW